MRTYANTFKLQLWIVIKFILKKKKRVKKEFNFDIKQSVVNVNGKYCPAYEMVEYDIVYASQYFSNRKFQL